MTCSLSHIDENWKLSSQLTISQLFYTFSIIFPGYGGILAGSNSSGQLARPQVSIPLGTITALVLGTLVYICTSISLTGCHDEAQLKNEWVAPLQESSLYGPIVFVALTASSIGKGITGLGAGPMVLRAMAADNLIPKVFGNWSRVIGTSLCIILCLWGDFNKVSSLSSMMFLTVFAFINHGVFLAMTAKVPSFRPHFRFYNAWIGLICALACFVSMFFINWWTALIAWVVAFILYYVTSERHIETQWGTLREAQHYSTALKAALNLRHIMPHPKLYRPNVVLLIDGNPACHTASITFMEQMLHDQGMAIVARMFPAETPIRDIVKERTRIGIRNKTTDGHIFYELVAAESRQEALEKVMLLIGLGSLRPNIVFIEFDEVCRDETANAIRDVLDRQWSLIILRRPKNISDYGVIDCWCLHADGGLELLIASILSKGGRKLRVLTFAQTDRGETVEHQTLILSYILSKFRIQAEVIVVPVSKSSTPVSNHSELIWRELVGERMDEDTYQDKTRYYKLMADAIRTYSSSAMVTVLSLPKPPPDLPNFIYLKWLEMLSMIPTSVLFVRGNGTRALSWQL